MLVSVSPGSTLARQLLKMRNRCHAVFKREPRIMWLTLLSVTFVKYNLRKFNDEPLL